MNENEGKDILSKWLETYGHTVYWESKNDYGWPAFNTRGKTRKRLDVLAINNTTITGIEFKPATDEHIRNGHKIADYCIDYINNEIQYLIDGVETTIHKFLLATRCSMNGKLHKMDNEYRPISNRRQGPIKRRQLPQNEFNSTFSTVRDIWKKFGKRFEGAFKPEIGVLLSGILDNKEPAPYSLIEYYKPTIKRRIQRWRPL